MASSTERLLFNFGTKKNKHYFLAVLLKILLTLVKFHSSTAAHPNPLIEGLSSSAISEALKSNFQGNSDTPVGSRISEITSFQD
uniref:Uncharacterized protein n=1 Tax=Rhodnius prolixus TaxID=13249 RepID=T1HRL7_RHOPR